MRRPARRLRAAAAPGTRLPRRRMAATVASAILSLSGLVLAAGPAAATAAGSVPPVVTNAQLTAAQWVPEPVAPGGPAVTGQPAADRAGRQARSFRRIILPDLLIVARQGLTRRQEARLAAITGVRSMIAFDGAEITAGGHPVSVIGVSPVTFRSWVPLQTASEQSVWSALSRGQFVAADAVARRLHLRAGTSYQLSGATARAVPFGSAARLGLSGVDLLVNQATSRKLGLVRQVAALISAPGVSMTRLSAAVAAVLGPDGRLESLRGQQDPAAASTGKLPATYLELFRQSAARYCRGLSWTVLAAIGQIESADGTNVGPSSAGALGPMQFEPATWAAWGIDGFGQTGPPDVLDPYDAVPAAARLLCADGAASGGHRLYDAIFDYNHAGWYVREVLALAARYAADYR